MGKVSSRARSCLVLLLALCAGAGAAEDATLQAQRKQFQAAWRAAAAGEAERARGLATDLAQYPLHPYLQYEQLRRTLARAPAASVREFLAREAGTWVGERLRTEWLNFLARAGRGADLVADWQSQDDVLLQCRYLAAKLRTDRAAEVPQDALPLWLHGKSQPDDCDPAFDALGRSALFGDELVWRRIELALAAGEAGLAQFLARRMRDAAQRTLAQRLVEVHANPARGLAADELRADTPRTRWILRHGIVRLARSDLGAALRQWDSLRARHAFDAEELGATARDLALAAARHDDARALELLAAIPPAAIDKAAGEAQLRAALRARAWDTLARVTQAAPAAGVDPLMWRYWQARALEQTGRPEAAQALYRELALERDYYGFLAADRLGLPYQMRDRPVTANAGERAAVLARTGVARAREWLALGQDYYARREWHFELPRLAARELEVAALLAHEWGWHDRAILTLGRAGMLDDMNIRFPLEHRALVENYAQRRGIPPALLYAIIRAESAFMRDARSSAGALGLMQLMPATARETAQRIGFNFRGADQLMEAQHNVTLGSAYLKQMLDRFGGHFALAAGAYNAGPGRIVAWRPPQDCVPADIWIELVPFAETRGYIQRTAFYAAVYEWRMEQEITGLQQRLASIPPRAGTGSC